MKTLDVVYALMLCCDTFIVSSSALLLRRFWGGSSQNTNPYSVQNIYRENSRQRTLAQRGTIDDGDAMPRIKAENDEAIMDELSRIGADKIATLSLSERTKRAMLAEAVEDQLFIATEQLDYITLQDGSIPEPQKIAASELMAQIQSLKVQYKELVSGQSSSVLNTLESALGYDTDRNRELNT